MTDSGASVVLILSNNQCLICLIFFFSFPSVHFLFSISLISVFSFALCSACLSGISFPDFSFYRLLLSFQLPWWLWFLHVFFRLGFCYLLLCRYTMFFTVFFFFFLNCLILSMIPGCRVECGLELGKKQYWNLGKTGKWPSFPAFTPPTGQPSGTLPHVGSSESAPL